MRKHDSELNIPLLDLHRQHQCFEEELNHAIKEVNENTAYILGPQVKQLEDEIAKYIGIDSSTGVASGTDALLIALRAVAIKSGRGEYFSKEDEIITTPFTFTATGGAILRSGATPVFVDIDPNTFNIDPKQIKQAVNDKTIGIVPVHLYGQACNMEEILTIAKEKSLFILEDVAQAFGASYKGKMLGAVGDAGAFSFFPSKNLGCLGDGGMVATSDRELAGLVGMLRKHGGKDKYDVQYLGYNSRLDTLQAAVLLVKLKHVDRLNKLRRMIAMIYNRELKDLEWLQTPDIPVDEQSHVYHQYTVRIKDGMREMVQSELQEKGIATAVYYPVPLHQMKLFCEKCKIVGNLKHTEKASREVLSLPIEPLLQEEEIDYVISSIRNIDVGNR